MAPAEEPAINACLLPDPIPPPTPLDLRSRDRCAIQSNRPAARSESNEVKQHIEDAIDR